MKLRCGTLHTAEMVQALSMFGINEMPPVKHAGDQLMKEISRILGREGIVQSCSTYDGGLQMPCWKYVGWLTDEEWLLVKMKLF